jgi:glucose-6-phosphate isomerase
MLAIGPGQFAEMLAGFHAVDEHFQEAPTGSNLPMLMGLLSVWYGDFFGAQTSGVVPYDQIGRASIRPVKEMRFAGERIR